MKGIEMATKTKKAAKRAKPSGNYPPNDLSRRERTRKEKRCQLCNAKTPLEDQYTVENDLEEGTVSARKNANRKGAETKSHYCIDCKDKRIAQKQAWLDARDGTSAPRGRPKGSGKAKPAAAKAKPKKAAKAKRAVKKPGRKKAASGSEPF